MQAQQQAQALAQAQGDMVDGAGGGAAGGAGFYHPFDALQASGGGGVGAGGPPPGLVGLQTQYYGQLPVAAAAMPPPPEATATLFLEHVPADASERELAHIFRPYAGFLVVRFVRVPSKSGAPGERTTLCFVDFATTEGAHAARCALQGYPLEQLPAPPFPPRLPIGARIKIEFSRPPKAPGTGGGGGHGSSGGSGGGGGGGDRRRDGGGGGGEWQQAQQHRPSQQRQQGQQQRR